MFSIKIYIVLYFRKETPGDIFRKQIKIIEKNGGSDSVKSFDSGDATSVTHTVHIIRKKNPAEK